jgi:hypothetical protein
MNPPEYDEFGFYIEPVVAAEPEVATPILPIRYHFPEAGEELSGGQSDGWEYRTVFVGSKLEYTYRMVVEFLKEHGYGDVPIPANADELKLFRKSGKGQLQLFSEKGYVHNPIKILFHPDRKMRFALILCLYNEAIPGHLLRFHGKI